VLAASAFATTLVMARFLLLSLHQRAAVTSPHATVSVIAWLVLLAVIAVFPFAFADAGDLMTGAVPLSAGALLAALALLMGARLPARIVLGNRRVAGRRLVSHFHKGVRGLTGAASQASPILSSALRSTGEPVRLSMKRRLIGLKMSSDSEYRWPLAGSVWLAIAGLLLGAFVLSP
jgi:hypothetical protein